MNVYRENLRTAVGASSAPYGHTLAPGRTGAVLANALGSPGALLFMGGSGVRLRGLAIEATYLLVAGIQLAVADGRAR